MSQVYQLLSESVYLLCFFCWKCSTVAQIKNYLKCTSAIKVATVKKTDDFHYAKEASCVTTEPAIFAVNKAEWHTKEESGKVTKNTLYMYILR